MEPDPSARQGSSRVSRGVAVLLVGVLGLAALIWMLWPMESGSPGDEPEASTPSPESRKRFVTADPSLVGEDGEIDAEALAEAASGELGLALRNRVCALCAAGALEPVACKRCVHTEAAGRVNLDVVGSDGRPFPDHEVMVGTSCGRMGAAGGGHLDLPEGRCELTATRVDGPFNVTGPPLLVDVVAGEESYALLEIPSDPWGGVGVTLRGNEEGVTVEGLLPNAAAEGVIPEGAQILEVEGVGVGDLSAREVGNELAGPAGTEVEVKLGWEGPDGWVEQTVIVERRVIKASEVSVTAGPPG